MNIEPRNKFESEEDTIETLCRRNRHTKLIQQKPYCDYICPDNDCIYKAKTDSGFKQYRCMSIDNADLWKYEK